MLFKFFVNVLKVAMNFTIFMKRDDIIYTYTYKVIRYHCCGQWTGRGAPYVCVRTLIVLSIHLSQNFSYMAIYCLLLRVYFFSPLSLFLFLYFFIIFSMDELNEFFDC